MPAYERVKDLRGGEIEAKYHKTRHPMIGLDGTRQLKTRSARFKQAVRLEYHGE